MSLRKVPLCQLWCKGSDRYNERLIILLLFTYFGFLNCIEQNMASRSREERLTREPQTTHGCWCLELYHYWYEKTVPPLQSFFLLPNLDVRLLFGYLRIRPQIMDLYNIWPENYEYITVFQVMAAVPLLRSPFLGGSLVFMIVYVWGREFPNARINIYGLVSLKVFDIWKLDRITSFVLVAFWLCKLVLRETFFFLVPFPLPWEI